MAPSALSPSNLLHEGSRRGSEVDTQAGSEGSTTMSETSSTSYQFFLPTSTSPKGHPGKKTWKNKQPEKKQLMQGPPGKWCLNSKAKIFVPGCPATHSAPASRRGMIPVHSAIKATFEGCLGSISMKVRSSYTEVGVTVLTTPSDMWGMDPIHALIRSRSYAMSTLMHALQIMGPQINFLQASADESRLHFKFCSSSPDRLCPEFYHSGQCSHPNTCCWEHVAMELFIITLVMKPAIEDAPPVDTPAPGGGAPPNGMMRGLVPDSTGALPRLQWSDDLADLCYALDTPMPPTMDHVPGMVYVPVPVMPMDLSIDPYYPPMMYSGQQALPGCARDSEGQTSSTAAGSSVCSGSVSPTELLSPCGTPRLHGRRVCWPDTDDGEDA